MANVIEKLKLKKKEGGEKEEEEMDNCLTWNF